MTERAETLKWQNSYLLLRNMTNIFKETEDLSQANRANAQGLMYFYEKVSLLSSLQT